MEPLNLQELAMQIARMPRSTQLTLLQAVLNLRELAPEEPEGLAQTRNHAPVAFPTLPNLPDLRSQITELTMRGDLDHSDAALLAAAAYVTGQGDGEAPFGTQELNDVIGPARENAGAKTKLNVHALNNLVKSGAIEELFKRPRFTLYRLTPRGLERARRIAEDKLSVRQGHGSPT